MANVISQLDLYLGHTLRVNLHLFSKLFWFEL